MLKMQQNKLFKKVAKNVKCTYRDKNFQQFNENDDDIGKMNNQCPHCNALVIKFETHCHEKKWSLCCTNGKITLAQFKKHHKNQNIY